MELVSIDEKNDGSDREQSRESAEAERSNPSIRKDQHYQEVDAESRDEPFERLFGSHAEFEERDKKHRDKQQVGRPNVSKGLRITSGRMDRRLGHLKG